MTVRMTHHMGNGPYQTTKRPGSAAPLATGLVLMLLAGVFAALGVATGGSRGPMPLFMIPAALLGLSACLLLIRGVHAFAANVDHIANRV